jgi:hypothetical protein
VPAICDRPTAWFGDARYGTPRAVEEGWVVNPFQPWRSRARPFVPPRLRVWLLGSLPADDVVDVSAFDVVDQTGDDLQWFKVRLGNQDLDVLA